MRLDRGGDAAPGSSSGVSAPNVPSCIAAPGAAGDLRELGVVDVAHVASVELAERRERDVLDVEVQAHADRVGGDEAVDLAGLEHRDLRVARARRERAEHHGRAAASLAQALGELVDVRHRERDDRAARRQTRASGVAPAYERRESRGCSTCRAVGHELAERAAHRVGAEDQVSWRPARARGAAT